MRLLVKEALGFALLAGLGIAGGFVGYDSTRAISDGFHEVITYNYPATQAMLRVELELYRLLATAREASREPSLFDEYRQTLADLHERLADFRRITRAMETSATPQMRDEVEIRQRSIETTISRLEQVLTALVAKAKRGYSWTDDDLNAIGRAGWAAFQVLELAVKREMNEADFNAAQANDLLALALQRLLGIVTLALTASVLLGFFSTIMVTRPLASLQTGVRRIAEGDLGVRLAISSSTEFAEVEQAFNDMAQKLHTYRTRLKAAKSYSESILTTMHDALFVVDPGGKILQANPAAGRLLELTVKDLIGNQLEQWICDRQRPEFTQLLHTDNDSQEVEIGLCSANHPEIPIILGRAPLRVPGSTHVRIVFVAHDLRKTHLLQRMEQANRELQASNLRLQELDRLKDDFLAVTSHELRTPLTAILGFAELMETGVGGPLTPEQAEFTGIIYKRGQDLLHIVEEILDVTRLHNGQVTIKPESIDLPELLDECLQTVADLVAQKDLTTELQPIDAPARWVQADPHRLRQIALNLLSNAIKFTPPGGLIRLHAARAGPAEIAISISDTGIGIAPELHEAIFDRFRQVQPHTTRTAEGLGLGLTITRMLVERHGGRIAVESAPGKGATFRFTMTAAPTQRAVATAAA